MASQLGDLFYVLQQAGDWDVNVFYVAIEETPVSFSEKLAEDVALNIHCSRALHAVIGKTAPSQGISRILASLSSTEAKIGLLRRLGPVLSNNKQSSDDESVSDWNAALTEAGVLTAGVAQCEMFYEAFSVHPLLAKVLLSTELLGAKEKMALAKTLCQRMNSPYHTYVMASMKSVISQMEASSLSTLASWYLNTLKEDDGYNEHVIAACESQTATIKASISNSVKNLKSTSPNFPEASLYTMIYVLSLPWDDLERHLAKSQGKNALSTLRDYLSLMEMTPMDFIQSRTMSSEVSAHAFRLLCD